jgi:hypothetical protein
MAPIAMIYNGVWSHYAMANAPKYRALFDLHYIHDIKAGDLEAYQAIVVPFQSHQGAMRALRGEVFSVLSRGGKVFVEGDSSWLDATWEDRPVNNYWWVTDPNNPPAAQTDYSHPVYKGLNPRHACWHTHGVYTVVPDSARIIQRNGADEIVTWETSEYGGKLLVTTLDPLVEHGVQQIRHLDNYVDNLVNWLCDVRPEGKVEIDWRIGLAA